MKTVFARKRPDPMDLRSLLGNFGIAAAAQATSFCISLLMSFLVPKVLGVEEFSYWQLFIFYSAYVGFFMFGLNDGIYLVHGGETRNQLDKQAIASQYLVGMSAQVVFALAIALLAWVLFQDEPKRLFVLVCISFYLVITNANGFLGYVFQAINETKVFSISSMLDKVVFLVPLLILLVTGADRFEPFVVSYVLSKCIALIYCSLKARFLFRSGLMSFRKALRECWESAKVGISLMLANVAGMLILGIARALIDAVWGIETFGLLSFSLTLANFFLSFVSQLAMVLFPALKQSNEKAVERAFGLMETALSIAFPLVFLLYLPICMLVEWWLPAYAGALDYLAVMLPFVIFESRMNLLGTTYFKVLRKERMLLAVNCTAVLGSLVLSSIGVFLVENINFVLISIIALSAARSIYSEDFIRKQMELDRSFSWVTSVVIAAVFIVANFLFNRQLTALLVSIAYIACLVIRRKDVSVLVQTISSKVPKKGRTSS